MSLVNYYTKRVGRLKNKAKLETPTMLGMGFRCRERKWINLFPLNMHPFSKLRALLGEWRSRLIWHQPRDIGRCKEQAYRLGLLVAGMLPLVLILLSCQSSHWDIPNTWTIYDNPRYGFEFPYPSNWLAFPMPDNRDGRAFRDPNDPNFEIRGWAGSKLSPIQISSSKNSAKESPNPQAQNFTTDQGLTGQLQVEVGSKISSMTLTLSQDKVQYNWQGQCESQQFADRYRFFYYIARQYRLPPTHQK